MNPEKNQVIVGQASTQTDLNYIEANDPDASYLWHKINGSQGDVGGAGGMMPLGQGMLSGGDIMTIESWINAGAPQ